MWTPRRHSQRAGTAGPRPLLRLQGSALSADERLLDAIHELDGILAAASNPAKFDTGIVDVDESGDDREHMRYFIAEAQLIVRRAIRAHYDT